MTTDMIASKTCGRCGGTGKYSFNLMDLDRCYGCGGSGLVPMKPKGQKAIKPTAELKNCKIGDVIKYGKVLYRIDRITWCKLNQNGNQRVRAIRLVDGKAFALYRGATYATKQGYGKTMAVDGTTYTTSNVWITPTAEMIGQDTDVAHIPLNEADYAEWLQWLSEREGVPVNQITVKG